MKPWLPLLLSPTSAKRNLGDGDVFYYQMEINELMGWALLAPVLAGLALG